MVATVSFYTRLATREGFNTSVRHINRTLELLDTGNPKTNLADEINRLLAEKEIDSEQIQSAVNMILVEKWKYSAVSRNLAAVATEPALVTQEAAKCKAVDMIIGYHHPDLGFIVLNPKNPESAGVISGFRKNEMVVLYAGTPDTNEPDAKVQSAAISMLLDLIEDRKAKAPAALLAGPFVFTPRKKAAAKKEAPTRSAKGKPARAQKAATKNVVAARMATGISTGPDMVRSVPAPAAPARAPAAPAQGVPGHAKMSALISVVVSNELFHNGNVEAWKRIIRSYNAKYPNLQVNIYYDGERIVDINTLFKWGKVKHGSCIQFAVAGENIQDLAKLQRYFKQGASPSFEAFLHGSPDTVMNLF